jgi:hypothetical protein
MVKQHLFETLRDKAPRDMAQIEKLIGRLASTAEIIDTDIRHEEQLASVSDPCDPAYPMIARTLKARRDNLMASIVFLRSMVNAGSR